MAETTLAERGTGPNRLATTGREAGLPAVRQPSRHLIPAADIYETPDEWVVLADLPGVSKEDVDVRVADGVLTIEGSIGETPVQDALYTEYRLRRFFRQFRLGEEVDPDRIAAELKNGVLTVHLPKIEPLKPRQIEVKVL